MTEKTPNTSAPKDEEEDNAQRIRQACLDHATDLVESAERVLKDNGYPNIAYHLAILALEEIGKAGMIGSRAVIGTARDTNWIERKLDDHVAKLQWAIWSPRLGGRIDPEDFEEARRFAQSTHARRLAGLYVNSEAGTATAPRLAVAREHATSVINLARSRLEIERVEASRAYDKSNENLRWFLDTMGDELGASRMLSKPFIGKYEELKGDTNAWVIWARRELEKIASDEQAHLKKELARSPSAPEKSKPKWVIKIRLYTPSHTIRPKILNFWNKAMDRVKLIHVGKKNELLLELTIDDSVPALNLYDIGFSMSKLCIAALNVGSLGFFWYDLPRQTSR